MTRNFRSASALLATLLLAACADYSPRTAAHVATGYVSHQLCSATFVGGIDPEREMREAVEPMAGPAAFLFSHDVDRARGEVRSTFAGMAESRATYRPGWGCVNTTGSAIALPADVPFDGTDAATSLTATQALLPAWPAPGPAASPALEAALDRAFAENPQPPHRNTRAIVVVHGDRIIAERYAAGIGADTPLPGWSATKSVTNALLGILVKQGKLSMNAPAPIAAWAAPNDPRHAITPDQLLRMTSGLDAGQALHDVGAFNPSARLLFVEADMAAFAASRPLAHAPGTQWTYTDANTLLLSRIVRDLAGPNRAAVRAFAHRELFDKLGITNATLEFDAAGTPIGSSHLWAPARAWARLGLLYLHDGVAGGERVLPAGWVDYSARATPLASEVGYGAGFWTNRDDGPGANYRKSKGIPADAFMARGSQGQYVLVIPSADLVIVRMGPAFTWRDDMDVVARLTSDVIEALR